MNNEQSWIQRRSSLFSFEYLSFDETLSIPPATLYRKLWIQFVFYYNADVNTNVPNAKNISVINVSRKTGEKIYININVMILSSSTLHGDTIFSFLVCFIEVLRLILKSIVLCRSCLFVLH